MRTGEARTLRPLTWITGANRMEHVSSKIDKIFDFRDNEGGFRNE